MKNTVEVIKKNLVEAAVLVMCTLFLCVSGAYIAPILITAVTKNNPIGLMEWIIGIAIPVISAGGAIFCILRINKINLKVKLILKLLAAGAMLIAFEVLYSFFSGVITELICGMISGSILVAKITLGIVLPLLKLPIYAVLICMICSISSGGKIFCRYGMKQYFSMLVMLFLIHIVALGFSMLGASMLAGVLQCILISLLATTAILVAKKTGEEYKNAKALV